MSQKPPVAMIVAGSEATGAAGIQVDWKTLHQLGVYGMGAITCIVSMDPKNNWDHRFEPVPPHIIADQMEACINAFEPDTVKLGMMGTVPTIDTVSKALSEREWKNVVVDPVLICKGQFEGPGAEVDEALRDKLLPLATVVTPNVFEASTLSGIEVTDEKTLAQAAQRIGEMGPRYVLAKGGMELPGEEAVDLLWDGQKITRYAVKKVGDKRVNGAGCTMAASITAYLARGEDVHEAVRRAKQLVTAGIEAQISSNVPVPALWQGGGVNRG
ncbi:bifunctional hydroxymethylpyrimidine kinase/phosphomethylpyrimidine kinase [Gleimia hominis]|uniref:bifunctional hydroxymethylpyrimidine kinase/phosphomethylpyrimidine kinase n=1 Tax=Gleimia hominis TaxID=595468 RepID=UPI000C80DE16|nr:bifunctional hydroxymethylpyrimidine kinase/phosphomethylpyrimidine kinase [Gleimia hominis]WIK64155.1 bifunctional hydroxymethylpyrimidine kinase/phosphomethylpyrimidine kinase [Gleimia hominis]